MTNWLIKMWGEARHPWKRDIQRMSQWCTVTGGFNAWKKDKVNIQSSPQTSKVSNIGWSGWVWKTKVNQHRRIVRRWRSSERYRSQWTLWLIGSREWRARLVLGNILQLREPSSNQDYRQSCVDLCSIFERVQYFIRKRSENNTKSDRLTLQSPHQNQEWYQSTNLPFRSQLR